MFKRSQKKILKQTILFSQQQKIDKRQTEEIPVSNIRFIGT